MSDRIKFVIFLQEKIQSVSIVVRQCNNEFLHCILGFFTGIINKYRPNTSQIGILLSIMNIGSLCCIFISEEQGYSVFCKYFQPKQDASKRTIECESTAKST